MYVRRLHARVNASGLPDLSAAANRALKAGIEAAETTGLRVEAFSVKLRACLGIFRDASDRAYLVTFVAVAGLACVGAAVVAWLVRKPADHAHEPRAAVARSASSVGA